MISYKIMFRKWFNTRSEIILTRIDLTAFYIVEKRMQGFPLKHILLDNDWFFWRNYCTIFTFSFRFCPFIVIIFFYYKRARIEMIICYLFFMMPVIYLFVLFLINDMFPWFYIPAMVLFSIFVWCLEWLIWVS